MKKLIIFLLCIGALGALSPSAKAEKELTIGILIYNAADTFMSNVYASIETASGGQAELIYRDSKNSQILQNEQVEQLLKGGVDALIINAVDRTSAVYLIRMARPYHIPVVFINREPLYEDLMEYEKAYYVGNNPKESGRMSGELVAEYLKAHPDADKNRDGVIQYVMLKGEPGHQDAELRTIYSVKALQDAGFTLEKLAEDTAMWERNIAQEKMAGFLSSFGGRIECVLSNNDDMALGAIEALKAVGYFTKDHFIPVVGVDATASAAVSLEEETLLGTVLNDAIAQGDAALRLAVLLANGETVDKTTFPYAVDRGVYVWIPSKKVMAESGKK